MLPIISPNLKNLNYRKMGDQPGIGQTPPLNMEDQRHGVTQNLTSDLYLQSHTEINQSMQPGLPKVQRDMHMHALLVLPLQVLPLHQDVHIPKNEMQGMPQVHEQDAERQDLEEGHQEGDTSDYYALLENLQKQFNESYNVSVELFEAEQAQRQTMNFYQRRNNALLELLSNIESEPDTNILELTKNRIENMAQMNPALSLVLEPLMKEDVPLKHAHKINMFIHEGILEIPNEGLENYERNPQDLEPWACRHMPHLTNSRYRKRFIAHNAHK